MATEAFNLSRRAYTAGQLGPGQVPLTFAQAVGQVNLAHTYLCPNVSQMPAAMPTPITETVTVTPTPVTITPRPVTVTATATPVTITATAQPTTATAPLTETVTRRVLEAVAPIDHESDNGGVSAPTLGVVLALASCATLGFVGAALWRLRPKPEHAIAGGGLDDAPPTWSWVHGEDYDDPAQSETVAAPGAETVIPES